MAAELLDKRVSPRFFPIRRLTTATCWPPYGFGNFRRLVAFGR